MKKNGMPPIPLGEILNEGFLKPLGLTANALAKAIGVPAIGLPRFSRIKEASRVTRQSGWERFSKRRRNSG
jgi:plasmid maintenance system antidote protein VapI